MCEVVALAQFTRGRSWTILSSGRWSKEQDNDQVSYTSLAGTVCPFTPAIFKLRSWFTSQSCGTESHYERRDCQAAVTTPGNLGNPTFFAQSFASSASLTAMKRYLRCQIRCQLSSNMQRVTSTGDYLTSEFAKWKIKIIIITS